MRQLPRTAARSLMVLFSASLVSVTSAQTSPPRTEVQLGGVSSVRLLGGPFKQAAEANRTYLLALDPDRLLAPFRREADLEPRKPAYPNWESGGLDGHTAGHYLSALSDMIAAGEDTAEGELRRRLNYMIDELEICQQANGDGYLGGVPGSRDLWKGISAGNIGLIWRKWVPWYNVHKTFAGLRDAYQQAGNNKARDLLIRLGDWAGTVTANLSDAQMQQMLGQEHGGMNESLADIYAITGDEKYLALAKRFNHRNVLEPLQRAEDRLNGLHANTQIPKVIGLQRIAQLSANAQAHSGADFFWNSVVERRSVAFGGNSVSEHFNDPRNFRGMLEHREGPETCNTYNMLRLTELLYTSEPKATYADYYERALYNHILASINTEHPGYVYFTPIRPGHYRVYSQPDKGFWCCVGTGMENPGLYGKFIYATTNDAVYVNLFISSEFKNQSRGLTLKQETAFPDESRTKLTVKLDRPATFALKLRHPKWVSAAGLAVKVNGVPQSVNSTPSSYATIDREWEDGDVVEMDLPMRTTVEGLPDGSPWYAIFHGPIVLASPTGTDQLVGLRAGAGRGDHIAHGPMVGLDKMPVLVGTPADVAAHVESNPQGGPLSFTIKNLATPARENGIPLLPFFRLHDSRYQMYFEVLTQDGLAQRQEKLAAAERLKLARDAATIDSVAVGEQQPETDHEFTGEGVETGIFNDRRWRHGRWFQYTLNAKSEKQPELSVTYSGGDRGRRFDVFVNGSLIAKEELKGEQPGEFVEKRYSIPADVLAAANGRLVVKFVGIESLAGGIFDLRLLRPDKPAAP